MIGPLRTILVLSDATGETAERVVRAALRQFDLGELPIDLRVFPHLRHEHDVDTVVAEARAEGALLVSRSRLLTRKYSRASSMVAF